MVLNLCAVQLDHNNARFSCKYKTAGAGIIFVHKKCEVCMFFAQNGCLTIITLLRVPKIIIWSHVLCQLHHPFKNKEFFQIATIEGPRVGGVWLVDWCICGPTRRALKTRSLSRLKFFFSTNFFFASILIGQEIWCLPYAEFLIVAFPYVIHRNMYWQLHILFCIFK